MKNERGRLVVKSAEFKEKDDEWIVRIVYAHSETPPQDVSVEDRE